MDSTIRAADLCILCHDGQASGQWQLCDDCRARLAERSAQRPTGKSYTKRRGRHRKPVDETALKVDNAHGG
jgi:hypothetical protein